VNINKLEAETVTAMTKLNCAMGEHAKSVENLESCYEKYSASLIAAGCYKPQCKYHEDVICDNKHQCIKSECELAPDISLV